MLYYNLSNKLITSTHRPTYPCCGVRRVLAGERPEEAVGAVLVRDRRRQVQ